ncbi:MAG: tRNA pseudouridine(13) synthase TruD [bacterium]|nr:tRNA pseudouridine(13) synthase TruD [bacterium]
MSSNEAGHPSDLPFLSAELPGAGGDIKCFDDDFQVEEIPLYEPSGEGTHVYLRIEKRGLTTIAAIELIAEALGRKTRDIGYAGLKDAHAVTRQTLSLEHVDSARVEQLDLPRIRILSVNRHRNKLKLGHLLGNRFSIRVRGVCPEALERASRVIDLLRRRGVPNYFGPQRFGARGDNADVGRAVLRGDFTAAVHILLGGPQPTDGPDVLRARELFDQGEYGAAANAWPGAFRDAIRACRAMDRSNGDVRRAWSTVNRSLQRLLVSAEQSRLFNQVLSQRISELDRLQEGDLAWKHTNGACFRVEDAAVEQPRCDAQEISPTGPLFGPRMTEATGDPGQLEADVLARAELDLTAFRRVAGMRLDGARRPLRVPLTEPSVAEETDGHGPGLSLSFALPAGSYATCVTREICKSERRSAPGPEADPG